MTAWMWRLTDEHAVLYTNDRSTLQAVLGYARFPHNDISAATTYVRTNGRAYAWQFTFPASLWNGVVRHLGRRTITVLDEEKQSRARKASPEPPVSEQPIPSRRKQATTRVPASKDTASGRSAASEAKVRGNKATNEVSASTTKQVKTAEPAGDSRVTRTRKGQTPAETTPVSAEEPKAATKKHRPSPAKPVPSPAAATPAVESAPAPRRARKKDPVASRGEAPVTTKAKTPPQEAAAPVAPARRKKKAEPVETAPPASSAPAGEKKASSRAKKPAGPEPSAAAGREAAERRSARRAAVKAPEPPPPAVVSPRLCRGGKTERTLPDQLQASLPKRAAKLPTVEDASPAERGKAAAKSRKTPAKSTPAASAGRRQRAETRQ